MGNLSLKAATGEPSLLYRTAPTPPKAVPGSQAPSVNRNQLLKLFLKICKGIAALSLEQLNAVLGRITETGRRGTGPRLAVQRLQDLRRPSPETVPFEKIHASKAFGRFSFKQFSARISSRKECNFSTLLSVSYLH